MGHIKVLDPIVSSQIAAGEVVESPASIVKELIENALDAGGKFIRITIEDGGLSLIQVEDDGIGMDEEDLKLSTTRHATSKISTLSDIQKIASYGFRGEAISSISSVSKFSIETRQASLGTGLRLDVEDGNNTISKIGRAKGTKIIVQDLFYNTPARKKFMKSARTEQMKIVDVLNRIALTNPTIGFTLETLKKPIQNLTSSDATTRFKTIFGEDLFDRLLEITSDHPFIHLKGFVGIPELATVSNPHQYLYVNSRSVRDPYIAHAVKSSFGTLIMPRSKIPFLLDLRLPLEIVDVNVHPRKEEVTFINRSLIYEIVNKSVSNALSGQNHTYTIPQFYSPNRESFGIKPTILNSGSPTGTNWQKQSFPTIDQHDHFGSKSPEEILQIAKTYLIKPTESGFIIIDQHAAHERINYEKLLTSYKKNLGNFEPLLLPLELTLSNQQYKQLENNQEILKSAGLVFEFTSAGIKLTAIPNNLKGKDTKAIILGFLGDLENPPKSLIIDDQSERALVYLSCRMSIKGGDFLEGVEREALITELAKCTLPYTCPHGRPVSLLVTEKDLQKMFKRTL